MGGTSWSDDHYSERVKLRAAKREPTFAYSSAVSSGKVEAKVHETLDPTALKNGVREARDSDEHPNSTPIFIGLDVTGSMQSVPGIIQGRLTTLMGLLLRQGFCTDPSICICGIGDIKYDSFPFQVGQFESGIEIENDLTNLILEGGGGGNRMESYELALFFLARCVKADAWEKRGQKGYAIIICDEELAPSVEVSEVVRTFGDSHKQQATQIPIDEILAEVNQKWELYVIIPNMTAHYSDPSFKTLWREKLGQRVLMLDDPSGISETIASIIGVAESSVDIGSLETSLSAAEVDPSVAASACRAVATVKPRGDVSQILAGDSGLTSL